MSKPYKAEPSRGAEKSVVYELLEWTFAVDPEVTSDQTGPGP